MKNCELLLLGVAVCVAVESLSCEQRLPPRVPCQDRDRDNFLNPCSKEGEICPHNHDCDDRPKPHKDGSKECCYKRYYR